MPHTTAIDTGAETARVPELAFPTPDAPHWGILPAVGVLLLSIALILFTPLLFVMPYVIGKGVGFQDQQALQEFLFSDRTAIILQLAPIVLAHALTLAAAWTVVTKWNTYSFRDALGWQMDGFRWWYSLPITLFFYGVVIGLSLVFENVENSFEQLLKRSRDAVYLAAFFATFTAPLVEEVVYRGLLYSAFQARLGMARAVTLVTLVFAAVHVPQYSLGTQPDLAPLIALLLLSLTLTLIRAKTRNLLPCIVLHTIFNGIQSALLVAEPYLKQYLELLERYLKPESTVEQTVSSVFFLLK